MSLSNTFVLCGIVFSEGVFVVVVHVCSDFQRTLFLRKSVEVLPNFECHLLSGLESNGLCQCAQQFRIFR